MSLNDDLIKVKKLFEAGPVFKPATPQQVLGRDKFAKPVMLPREVRDAIDEVLEYSYYNEQDDWESYDEDERKRPKDHIYNSLKILANFVGWSPE
jgi:hypothetical protein